MNYEVLQIIYYDFELKTTIKSSTIYVTTGNKWMWLFAHLASLFVPLAMTMSIVNLIYTVFVPILTANGGTIAFEAEMSIAILTTAT